MTEGTGRMLDLPGPTPLEELVSSHLQESITAALQGVDPGHGHAIIDLDQEGLGAIAVQRLGNTWKIVTAAKYHWHGKPEFQVAVRADW